MSDANRERQLARGEGKDERERVERGGREGEEGEGEEGRGIYLVSNEDKTEQATFKKYRY